MKAFTLSFFIIASTCFSLAQFNSISSNPIRDIRFSTTLEPTVWLDSTRLNFVKITLTETVEVQEMDAIQVFDTYYSNVASFCVQQGDCCVYPLTLVNSGSYDSLSNQENKHLIGLFLVDDFDTDSLEVVVTIQSGHMRQSQMYSTTQRYRIPLDLKVQTGMVHENATKRWYKRWIKNHPHTYVMRRNYAEYFKDCTD